MTNQLSRFYLEYKTFSNNLESEFNIKVDKVSYNLFLKSKNCIGTESIVAL